MSNIKNDKAKMLESWRICRERYIQLQQQMTNSAKGTGTADSKPGFPVPETFHHWSPSQTNRYNIKKLLFRQKLLGQTDENISNPAARNEGKNFGGSMEEGPADSILFRSAKARLKVQTLESNKTGSPQNCFDVRNMESPRDFGPITKNSTKDSRSLLSLFHSTGYAGGLIPDQAPSPVPLTKTDGGTEGKNSKRTSQVSENSHQSSDQAGAEVDAVPMKKLSLSSSRVFSPPLEAPEILPQQGNGQWSYGTRGRGRGGREYSSRMNSYQGRGRVTKVDQDSRGVPQSQDNLSRFPKRGEQIFRRKPNNDPRRGNRGRRSRGVPRGGKPRNFNA